MRRKHAATQQISLMKHILGLEQDFLGWGSTLFFGLDGKWTWEHHFARSSCFFCILVYWFFLHVLHTCLVDIYCHMASLVLELIR